jgi:hypothetical protein
VQAEKASAAVESEHSKVAPVAVEVKLKDGFALLLGFAGFAVIVGALGATVAIVNA